MKGRLTYLLAFISFILPVQFVCGQGSSTRINNYDIAATLDTAAGLLNVKAMLAVDKTDSTELLLLLMNSAVRLDSIIADAGGNYFNIPHEFTGKDTLQLRFPESLRSDSRFSLNFYYSYPIGKPTDIPLVIDRGHRWYPLIMDNIARLYLTVTTTGDFEAFSAGDMTSMTQMTDSTWTVWETAFPVFKIPLVIARRGYYREITRSCGNEREISLYYVSADSATAQSMIDEVCRSFEFYSEYVGGYGHNTLRLLEVPQFPGTNIGTGIITFGKNEIEAFKVGNKDQIDLAVADQWIGAGIFSQFPSRGFWFMSISMPHYLRMTYLQNVEGEQAFQKTLNDSYNAYRPIAGTDKDIPILDVDFLNTKEKGAIIYGKGPYVINILRNRIGNEPWQRLWRGLFFEFKGKILSFDQLIEYMATYDGDGTAISEFKKLLNEKGLLPQ